MVITYYGAACFKVQVGETVFVFDPPAKDSPFKTPRFQANVVFSSHGHPEAAGTGDISGKDGRPPVILDGPGEYETHGVMIRGTSSFHDDENGKKRGRNTAYSLAMEGISLVHLGDFGEQTLRKELIERLGEPDILFIPVGGGEVLGPQTAAKLAVQLEPAVVIPMRYEEKKGATALSEFVKEFSKKGIVAPVEKFTVKKRDLSAHEGSEVVVLAPCLS